jgi:hypothetical protein
MDVPVNARVECIDGGCGRSVYAIVHQGSEQITHVVVEQLGLSGRQRLVPVDYIRESTPERIDLRCSQDELQSMPAFDEHEYVRGEGAFLAYPPGHYMFGPEGGAGTSLAVEHEQVQAGELAVRRGARVEATDGSVGQVDEFLIDPVDRHITHLVLHQGHLWGQRDVTIPASAIERIAEDVVYLKLDKRGIESLPGTPPRH